MNVSQLKEHFEKLISPTLSCEWDNDGLMLCSDSSKEIKKALVTLDLTESAVEKALECGVDCIFTHHPFIFKPLKSICDTNSRARMIFRLAEKSISVFSYHTRLDALQGGVNDVLVSLLSINNAIPLGEGELSMARIGSITPCALSEFSLFVKEKLHCPSLCVAKSDNGKDEIKRVAVLGGASDKDFINAAIEADADVFLTGDASYNSVIDANIDGMHVICAGHYFTENPVLEFFKKELGSLKIEGIVYNCGYFEYL